MNPAPVPPDSDVRRVDREASPGRPLRTRGADAIIEELAASQHGAVARRQLLEAGVPRHAVDYRVGRGRLRLLHRGVYACGPIPGAHQREMAAVLACGPGAVVSHGTAARLQGLLRARPADPLEVTTHPGHPERGPSIRVHRSPVAAADRTTLDGVPITTVARTVLDLAARLDGRRLEQVLARGRRLRTLDEDALRRLLDRHPRRAGSPLLRALLDRRREPALVRSEAEALFLALVRRAGLEAPEVNVVVRGHEVDFLWREARLIVEVDGFAFHGSGDAFERDRARDGLMAAAGFRVMRVTWRHLKDRRETVLVRLAQALVRAG